MIFFKINQCVVLDCIQRHLIQCYIRLQFLDCKNKALLFFSKLLSEICSQNLRLHDKNFPLIHVVPRCMILLIKTRLKGFSLKINRMLGIFFFWGYAKRFWSKGFGKRLFAWRILARSFWLPPSGFGQSAGLKSRKLRQIFFSKLVRIDF